MKEWKVLKPKSPNKIRDVCIALEYFNDVFTSKQLGDLFGISYKRVVQIANIHLMFILNKKYNELAHINYYRGLSDIKKLLNEYAKFIHEKEGLIKGVNCNGIQF